MAVSSSTTSLVRLAALGGLGEIGLNLLVVEYGGYGIIVDAGVMFPPRPSFGRGLLMPDLAYLEQSRIELLGVFLTHAHEDHIGALPHLIKRFPLPVHGTALTLAFARRRLQEYRQADGTDLRTFAPGKIVELGPFRVEAIRVTHSTPDSIALAISTPAGVIVHSGDFKIDEAPVDGQRFDRERFARLGAKGVELLLSDSTNVERPGRSVSESSLKPILRELVLRSRSRFFLSAFSSHIHRIRQVAEISRDAGRLVVPLGRRMIESVRMGVELGQLDFPPGTFIDVAEADFVAAKHLTFLTGGSQAEPSSALTRLAADNYPRVHVEAGDTVVLSSRFIPGNERPINTLINDLYKLGADVVYETVAPVHASGHASRDELLELIRLVRPKFFVPIHGEYRHLSRHVALAAEAGIPPRNCFLLENGDVLVMENRQARRGPSVTAGRMPIGTEASEDPILIDERRALAHGGTIVAVVAISSKTGKITAGPELISRGLVSGDGTSVHMRRVREELTARLTQLEGPLIPGDLRVRDEIMRTLQSYFIEVLGKRPLVVPHLMEV
ncbi:MAG: ribonuclease J [Candidatus Binataceae bacterium]